MIEHIRRTLWARLHGPPKAWQVRKGVRSGKLSLECGDAVLEDVLLDESGAVASFPCPEAQQAWEAWLAEVVSAARKAGPCEDAGPVRVLFTRKGCFCVDAEFMACRRLRAPGRCDVRVSPALLPDESATSSAKLLLFVRALRQRECT